MNLDKIVTKSKDILHQVEAEIGETIGLGTLLPGTGDGIVLAEAEGTSGFSYHLQLNYRFPIHTSSPGKAMLAYLSKEERDAYYEHMDFKIHTPNTITCREDFDIELESVLEKGYSIDVSEQIEGCHCVGVPIFDPAHKMIAALWATGPSSQLPLRSFPQIAAALKKGSLEITQRMSSSNRAPNRAYINSVVQQSITFMQSNLHQTVDTQEMAKNLNVSYSWFRKVFKETTGEAPAEYHLMRRIEKACELLKETPLSVKKVSENLGFKNQNHFSALFKRKIGLSPLQYRNQRLET